jgi:hypothetical protein
LISTSVIQACGFTALSLQLSMSEAKQAQLSTPSSLPANGAFFLQGQRPHRALDGTGLYLDAAVIESWISENRRGACQGS